MIARLHSIAFSGIDAVPVEIEVDVAPEGDKLTFRALTSTRA